MPFLDNLKAKFNKKSKSDKKTKKTEKKDEGEVHILPVPGNTNVPPGEGGGLNSDPNHPKGPGPVILSPEQANALGEPKTREQLHAEAAALNA